MSKEEVAASTGEDKKKWQAKGEFELFKTFRTLRFHRAPIPEMAGRTVSAVDKLAGPPG